ncbi:MAG: DUF177 domain-containing protein [Chloroflexota bacterium]
MNKKRYSLRLNVGYFKNRPIGFSRDFNIIHSEIFIDPDLNVGNLASEVRFSRTREGLLLQAQVKGEIETSCVRCLNPFYQQVSSKIEELYEFLTRSRDNPELILPEDGYIDLGQIFREYLLLDVPINMICKSDCKGLCSECGQNLNEKTCEHSPLN